MARYGMLIDRNLCVGCMACAVACKVENGTPRSVFWTKVLTEEVGTYPTVSINYTPLLCMHCADAPCVDVCPTGASHKRADGIVVVDYDKCIGCKYCIQACPYGARTYMDQIAGYFPGKQLTPYEAYAYQKHQVGVVEKCTFCSHRIDQAISKGRVPGVDRDATPACVITCISGARVFGNVEDPESEVSKQIAEKHARPMKPELDTKPKVYYVGLTEGW